MEKSATAGLQLRDKDAALAERCKNAAEAASEAVNWLGQHRDPSPTVQNLQRGLRRQVVEMRRLATAAARPMSVGVFGASQAGKSFLIGSLIQSKEEEIKIVFGQGDAAVRQDFLQEINPAGGDETTGLVTRFSLRSYDTPAGNPVVLRLLREVDIAKILTNSFRFDLKGQYKFQPDPESDSTEDRTPTSDRIEELADRLTALRKSEPQPGMTVEDVYELREYVEKHLDGHYLGEDTGERYWLLLEEVLPFLDVAGRTMALAPLWAELEELSDLFSRLKAALDQLGHPFRVFTGLAALADRSRGVLHVNTLRDLDAVGTVETLAVVSDGNINATLPMCIVTALTAELCVTLEAPPWGFFTHTDLLDFPGARSRENKAVADLLRDPSEPLARSNCFLRGKVAVLFDNYAADLDLNLMMLCAGPENQEVKTLPGLVQEWISRTHGATVAERGNGSVGLFYCLTKCDTLFVERVGQENAVQTRIENNIKPYAWAKEWAPGKAFDNLFLIRNPEVLDRGLFTYADVPEGAPESFIPAETGRTDEFNKTLETSFKPQFFGEPLVADHVSDPEKKLDALLDDGGTSLLAQSLAPVCNLDVKYDQIFPRAEATIAHVTQSLTGFHESGDINKRVAERSKRIQSLIDALKKNRHDIGPFITDFQIDVALLEAAYRHYRRHAAESESDEDIWDDDPSEERASPASGFGKTIVEWWARHLASKVSDSPWHDQLGIDDEVLRGFVEELVIGAERRRIGARLEDYVDQFTQNTMILDEAARRISIIGAFKMNDELNFPGGQTQDDDTERFGRQTLPVTQLPEDPRVMDRLRIAYYREWMDALLELTVTNASWGSGGAVDVQANEELGSILNRLGWTE